MCTPHASAWSWNSEPQPLLENEKAIRADAGSSLAWDNSSRVLWYIAGGNLARASWSGTTFRTAILNKVQPKADGKLLVDPGLHFVYLLDTQGKPICVRKKGSKWLPAAMGDEQLQMLLGVDEKLHRLFAYDAGVRGIRMYSYNRQDDAWISEVIATGLGSAGDAGAVDAAYGTIYTTHESADESIPRKQDVPLVADPSGTGLLKAWPLVVTSWDGTQWTSRVICETGVPQQPALRHSDRSLFFATRKDYASVRVFKPKQGDTEEYLGAFHGYAGRDTYEDHDRYKIREPKYPKQWLGNAGSSVTSYGFSISYGSVDNRPRVQLTPPIEVIPYYEPIWRQIPLDLRLAHFRAVVNPRQKQLVQHRQVFDGEVIREQRGMRLAGYLYRDGQGIFTRRVLSNSVWEPFRQLGPEFDPHNMPARFALLSNPDMRFYTYEEDLASKTIPAECTIDPNSPFVSAYLRQPKTVLLRTFGHQYVSPKVNQPGSRYRSYSELATGLAIPSSIAVDRKTGITFYTQAPPNKGDMETMPKAVTSPSYSAFQPEPDPKFPRPDHEKVWIVMVY